MKLEKRIATYFLIVSSFLYRPSYLTGIQAGLPLNQRMNMIPISLNLRKLHVKLLPNPETNCNQLLDTSSVNVFLRYFTEQITWYNKTLILGVLEMGSAMNPFPLFPQFPGFIGPKGKSLGIPLDWTKESNHRILHFLAVGC